MVQHRLARKNYDEKLPVSIKCQNLHFFKEARIHLCQSIVEMRQISHLHGLDLFAISLNSKGSSTNNFYHA